MISYPQPFSVFDNLVERMLESAIPPHLSVDRTRPVKTPADYEPPYPAYSARLPKSTKDIVMAILGVQAPKGKLKGEAVSAIIAFVNTTEEGRPSFWDVASVVDKEDFENTSVIAYWKSKDEYLRWCSSSGFESWWQKLQPGSESHGWFREVFFPPVERFETVFSDNAVPEGAAHMREGISGPVLEHVYWGSARDRLPVSQTDSIEGEKYRPKLDEPDTSKPQTNTQRIRVQGKPNVCVIRSGQDWSATSPKERTLYLETMHPVLIKGMDFLRDEGEAIGCYSCRFMSVVDSSTFEANTDKTFGLAFFDDLDSLEAWSREHKTHLDIFGRFLQYAQELNNEVSLRLFHEVLVLQPDQQSLEYIGCHPKTGFLSGYRGA